MLKPNCYRFTYFKHHPRGCWPMSTLFFTDLPKNCKQLIFKGNSSFDCWGLIWEILKCKRDAARFHWWNCFEAILGRLWIAAMCCQTPQLHWTHELFKPWVWGRISAHERITLWVILYSFLEDPGHFNSEWQTLKHAFFQHFIRHPQARPVQVL
jgi:hypothetical protein